MEIFLTLVSVGTLLLVLARVQWRQGLFHRVCNFLSDLMMKMPLNFVLSSLNSPSIFSLSTRFLLWDLLLLSLDSFQLLHIFYKCYAKILTLVFFPAKQDSTASYFMEYILPFIFLYGHFLFLNYILNLYRACGLLDALILLWRTCHLAHLLAVL